MRALWIAALVLLSAGCSVETTKAIHADGGYAVEVRANGDDQVFMVTGPHGQAVAARAHDGASALLSAAELQQALATMPAPPSPPLANADNAVSISAPGFSLHVTGDNTAQQPAGKGEGDNTGRRGDITMNIGGFGMHVNADDGGAGGDRAQVRLTGLSAQDVHRFITGADELSPAVQAQMLTALGLSQDQ